MLVESGKVDVDSKDDYNCTPLFHAAACGHGQIVEFFLKTDQVDVNPEDNSGRAPLSIAASRGHIQTVDMLVRHRRVAVDARDTLGLTPLLYAASKGHRVAMEMLLHTGQVDMNSYKAYGCMDWFRSGENFSTVATKQACLPPRCVPYIYALMPPADVGSHHVSKANKLDLRTPRPF